MNIKRLLLSALFISGLTAFAQDCKRMLPFNEGAVVAYKNYDKKEKLTGKSKTTYSKVVTEGSSITSTATSEFFDKDGESINKAEYVLKCDNGNFKVDMSMMMPNSTTAAFKDMEMDMKGDNVVYPSVLNVGDNLPLGKMEVTVTNSGVTFANISMEYTQRKVEAKEEVETPAGTYTCYKISEEYSSSTAMTVAGMTLPAMKITGKSVNWYNAEVGNVKTESYDQKGKLLGVTILDEIKK